MGIVSSTIRIYADAAKTTLLRKVTTPGTSTSIEVTGLTEGTEYWATAQVTDDNNLTSAESATYRFYTLPDVLWYTGSPGVSGDTISYQLNVVTDSVDTSQLGIVYSTDPTWATYSKYNTGNRADGDLSGLAENTTYHVAPYCIDEFNREWINFDAETSLTTPYAVPTLSWTGQSTTSATTWSQQINITSTAAVSSVVLHYKPTGGSESTVNLPAQTGTQTCSLTGLTPSTNYRIWVTAVNTAGTGTSATLTQTTDAPEISLALDIVSTDNTSTRVEVRDTITKDDNITLKAHELRAYTNILHSGQPVEAHIQSSISTSLTETFSQLEPDATYYLFGYAEYTVSGSGETYTAWSSPIAYDTLTMLSFGKITTTNTTAYIPYSVSGTATSIAIDYSADNGSTWTSIPVKSLTGDTLQLTGLTLGTTYLLRGKTQNQAGWTGYFTDSFTTTAVARSVSVSSVSDVDPTTATVNISVSEAI